jgi:hypothetical protein
MSAWSKARGDAAERRRTAVRRPVSGIFAEVNLLKLSSRSSVNGRTGTAGYSDSDHMGTADHASTRNTFARGSTFTAHFSACATRVCGWGRGCC